jgi:hypothetical protein
MKVLTLSLLEPKKHSGKYAVEETKDDQWPVIMYLKKEWFPNDKLPKTVKLTIETVE